MQVIPVIRVIPVLLVPRLQLVWQYPTTLATTGSIHLHNQVGGPLQPPLHHRAPRRSHRCHDPVGTDGVGGVRTNRRVGAVRGVCGLATSGCSLAVSSVTPHGPWLYLLVRQVESKATIHLLHGHQLVEGWATSIYSMHEAHHCHTACVLVK